MNYTLHQLHIFLKVVQAGSVTKASQELHLTQPAVSIQLKNFQDQFEIPLTEVIGRKLYVTDFGKEVAQAAEKILDEVHMIDYKTQAFRGQLTGRLRISVVSTGKYIMPYFLSDFLKQHQHVELLLDVTNKARVVESIENNEVDFSLVSVLPTHVQLERIELMQNKLYVVANRDYASKEQLHDKKIFEQIPLIYREQGSGTRYVMERFMERSKIQVIKKMELTSNEAVKQAVLAGLGCSIMPLIGIKNELISGELKIIQVKGFPIKSIWSLIWSKQKKLSPVAIAFLQYLKHEKQRIVQRTFDWYEDYD